MPTIRPVTLIDALARSLGGAQQPQQQQVALLPVIIAVTGGLTAAGIALGGGVAAATTYLALLSGSSTELGRAPVLIQNGVGLATFVQALFGPTVAYGFMNEVRAYGGAATSTPGSGRAGLGGVGAAVC